MRFLLLTNPNNPLGVIYKPNVLLEAVEWARSRQMHTIVDEIYALSRHKVRRPAWFVLLSDIRLKVQHRNMAIVSSQSFGFWTTT